MDGQLGLFRIALVVGTRPTWAALEDHLDQTFVIGMPIEEVHKELERIGRTTFIGDAPDLGESFCQWAIIDIGLFGLNQWKFKICYDDKHNLVSFEFAYS